MSPYKEVQFIAHCIHTAPVSLSNDKAVYKGLPSAQDDIKERIKLVSNMLNQAYTNADSNDKVLKILMMPEFFFRGSTGAYSMDDVQKIVKSLQDLVEDNSKWKNWMFVFGSIIGKSFATKENSMFKRLFGGDKYIIDRSKNVEAYNYVLVQKGGFGSGENAGPDAAKVVLKEHKSGMDFIKKENSVSGIVWERVDHLVPSKASGSASEEQNQSYDGNAIFKIDGITFGLEICLDHAEKRLKKSKNLPTIDIQLVPSCGMELQSSAIVTKKNGYAFNCDGYANYTTNKLGYNSALQKVGGSAIKPASETSVSSDGINIVEIYALGAGTLRVYPKQTLA